MRAWLLLSALVAAPLPLAAQAEDGTPEVGAWDTDASNADASDSDVSDSDASDSDASNADASNAARAEATDSPSPDFITLVQDALSEFRLSNYEEAADLFRAAYEIRASALALRGLGDAYFELGRYVDAAQSFEEALASTVDPLSETLRGEVEERMDRAHRHVGTLVLRVDPPDATVHIAGASFQGGRSLRLDEGTYTARVSAPGYENDTREIRVVPQDRFEVSVLLDERQAPTTILQNEPSPTGAVAAGIVAAAGVVVTVGSAVWLTDRVQAASRCDDGGGVVCSNRGVIDTERRASAAVVGIGLAVAVAGAVGVLVSVRRRRARRHTQHAGCAPVNRGVSCALSRSF
ncbi:MAG: tetratricopeptide repeat protein [Myxococcota bacterium]